MGQYQTIFPEHTCCAHVSGEFSVNTMNERYFACPKCQIYISAGYRWAYWQLENTQHVSLNDAVNVENLLKVGRYWNPQNEEKNDWLCKKVLPNVKEFLKSHSSHGVIYLEEDTILSEESLSYNWSEIQL